MTQFFMIFGALLIVAGIALGFIFLNKKDYNEAIGSAMVALIGLGLFISNLMEWL